LAQALAFRKVTDRVRSFCTGMLSNDRGRQLDHNGITKGTMTQKMRYLNGSGTNCNRLYGNLPSSHDRIGSRINEGKSEWVAYATTAVDERKEEKGDGVREAKGKHS
jgi:hypothetical protein